jgi:hypothetical protein
VICEQNAIGELPIEKLEMVDASMPSNVDHRSLEATAFIS